MDKILKIAGAFGGPVASIGSSIIGNLFGKSNQDKANEANLKINQMNNAFNEKMMEKQMSYNTDMWNKQNAYNSPIEQVKRLKEAGINPMMAMQGTGGGVAQSALGVNGATASNSVAQQGYQPDMSGFNNAAQMMFQKRMQEAQIKNIQQDTVTKWIENMTLQDRNIAMLEKLRKETDSIDLKMDLDRRIFRLNQRQMNQDYYKSLQDYQEQSMNMVGQAIDIAASHINLLSLPAVIKNNILQQIADIRLTENKSVSEGYRQAQIQYDILESVQREYGYHLDNKQKEETRQAIADILKSKAFWSDFQYGSEVFDNVTSGAANAIGLFSPKRLLMPTKQKTYPYNRRK